MSELTHAEQTAVDTVEAGLSRVYRNGFAYGIAYIDGLGNIELLDRTFTCPEHAQAAIDDELHVGSYYADTLVVVALKVKRAVSVTTLKVLPPEPPVPVIVRKTTPIQKKA